MVLFRSPTLTNLAVGSWMITAASTSAFSDQDHAYIDTDAAGSRDESCPKRSAHASPCPYTSAQAQRPPHALDLGEGRYALAFCDLHTIPEDHECPCNVHMTVRFVVPKELH